MIAGFVQRGTIRPVAVQARVQSMTRPASLLQRLGSFCPVPGTCACFHRKPSPPPSRKVQTHAQPQQATSEPALVTTSSGVQVVFKLARKVPFGDSLAVCGHSAELGCWDLSRAMVLRWEEGDVWTGQATLLPGKQYFKFITIRSDGEAEWEPGPDRVVEALRDAASMSVRCTWLDTSDMAVAVDSFRQLPSFDGPTAPEPTSSADAVAATAAVNAQAAAERSAKKGAVPPGDEPSPTDAPAAATDAPPPAVAASEPQPNGDTDLRPVPDVAAGGGDLGPASSSSVTQPLESVTSSVTLNIARDEAGDTLSPLPSSSTSNRSPTGGSSSSSTSTSARAATTAASSPSKWASETDAPAQQSVDQQPPLQRLTTIPRYTKQSTPLGGENISIRSSIDMETSTPTGTPRAAAAAPTGVTPSQPQAKGSLHLVAGACIVPHVDKVATGGEDAYFISTKGYGALGVADGVSAWSDDGIDPGDFSRGLMQYAAQAVEDSTGDIDTRQVIHYAQYCTYKPGSATIIVAVMKPSGRLEVANLGDCNLKVIRHHQIALSTEPQQHEFNLPYQISHPKIYPDTDYAQNADKYAITLRRGDALVMSSDGLTDNMWDDELVQIVEAHKPAPGQATPEAAERLARALAVRAHEHARDENFKSPFSIQIGKQSGLFSRLFSKGGKMDDITAVVAFVQ